MTDKGVIALGQSPPSCPREREEIVEVENGNNQRVLVWVGGEEDASGSPVRFLESLWRSQELFFVLNDV
jgi:hypothetical protein